MNPSAWSMTIYHGLSTLLLKTEVIAIAQGAMCAESIYTKNSILAKLKERTQSFLIQTKIVTGRYNSRYCFV